MLSRKTIAKNTFFLYFRMAITMPISLYTSRVVLNALGFVDYGLYNVIGGGGRSFYLPQWQFVECDSEIP